MRTILLLTLTTFLIACNSTISAKEPHLTEQESFLIESVQNTPYSAVIKHLDVKVIPSDYPKEFQHVYNAKVLKTLKGETLETISYSMLVETEEEPVLEKNPILITLCKDQEGYYWPGTGAQFQNTRSHLELAEKAAALVYDSTKQYSHCDQ